MQSLQVISCHKSILKKLHYKTKFKKNYNNASFFLMFFHLVHVRGKEKKNHFNYFNAAQTVTTYNINIYLLNKIFSFERKCIQI